jgi:sugar lactone lactonase YvrE
VNIIKALTHLAAATLILGSISGCGGGSSNPSSTASNSGIPSSLRKASVLTEGSSFLFNGIETAGTSTFVFDSQGNIFYPDVNGYKLMKIDTNGNQSVYMQCGQGFPIYRPMHIAIDHADNLYIDDAYFTIRKISPSGVVTTMASLPWSRDRIIFMAVDSVGNVYTTTASDWSHSSNVIQKITPNGTISVFAGSGQAGNADGQGTNASFNFPQGIAVDSQDNVFVGDGGNKLIRKITPAGEVTTFAGSGTQNVRDGIGTDSDFYFYQSMVQLAIDSDDILYVAEYADSEGYIRTVDQNGQVTTICGAVTTNYDHTVGPCNEILVWVTSGIVVRPDKSIYYLMSDKLYRIGM